MYKKIGRLTLPSEQNFLEETKIAMQKLGADAIRDSDGTKLPDEIKDLEAKIYTTYFVARGDNEFAKTHMEECQHFYLMTEHCTAVKETLEIPLMKGYFAQQVKVDYDHDPQRWWELIDRTTKKVVPTSHWTWDSDRGTVLLSRAKPYHQYTVSFLAYAIWDPTQMYNHITNDWGDKEHEIPFDVRKKEASKHVEKVLEQWLKDNPKTDIVRFTTFFYHFTLVFNEEGKEKFVDWFGYSGSVSVEAMEEFERQYGYTLRPEDIVDEGYYNSTYRIPSKRYLDYMEFQQKFVSEKAGRLVDLVHRAGKEAVMFLGDNWIGTEPYGKYFKNIGLDGVVGSVGDGVTLRIISDIADVKFREGRFLPYFFPDTFYIGNDPVIEAKQNWMTARRALVRKPLDRIGYGGYLSLAYQFPEFMDYIAHVADEFREIYDKVSRHKTYSSMKVAILNSWGSIRSWQAYTVAHGKWYELAYSYMGVMEALSGMDMDVCFINFDDVRAGLDPSIDVIVNAGDAYTAFSGGEAFADENVVCELRRFVYEGGGFIGVGEPSALQRQGRYFQLADIMGVDKEVGFSQSHNKYFVEETKPHFVTEEIPDSLDFGRGMKSIYALSADTQILNYRENTVNLAVNDYGRGRGAYLSGMPYSLENSRMLKKLLHYVAHKEKEMQRYYARDYRIEVVGLPETGEMLVLNNSNTKVETVVYGNTKEHRIEVESGGIRRIKED